MNQKEAEFDLKYAREIEVDLLVVAGDYGDFMFVRERSLDERCNIFG